MRLSQRQVYVVKGSEDGNLGVFSNIKLAWARCEKYLNCDIGVGPIDGSYGRAIKRLQAIGVFTAYRDTDGGRQICATIECHNLNYST